MTQIRARMGLAAISGLLNELANAPDGAVVSCALAAPVTEGEIGALLLVSINHGRHVALTPVEARGVAAFCLDTAPMPPLVRQHLGDGLAAFARLLLETVAEAEAMAPARLQ